eukprot:4562102-Lingulodinium_polyedra.AAC.1
MGARFCMQRIGSHMERRSLASHALTTVPRRSAFLACRCSVAGAPIPQRGGQRKNSASRIRPSE